MKKYFRFTLLTLAAALLFTACSNEDEIATGGNVAGTPGTITFTLPGAKGVTTYAPTATDAENSIENLQIYMFDDATGNLVKVYKRQTAGDITIGGTGTNLTATIATEGAGSKTFYFVNPSKENKSLELEALAVGQKGLPLIKDYVTITQTAPITTDLTSTPKKELLMSAKAIVPNIESTTAFGPVTLKRRVARFDIKNPLTTDFVITGIEVANANLSTTLFADATGTHTPPTGTINIPLSFTAAEQTAGLKTSAFYLYPTSLTNTSIVLKGTLGGLTKEYQVNSSVNIEANKRYNITVKKVQGQLVFDIVIADWELVTEELEAFDNGVVIDPASFTFTGAALTNQATKWNPTTMVYNITDNGSAGGTIKFKARSSSASIDTKAKVVFVHETDGASVGGKNGIVLYKNGVLIPAGTYAGGTEHEYEVKIPTLAATNSPIDVEIRIGNANAEGIYQKIILRSQPKYNGTAYEPVLYKGKYWAPVNVGATSIDATVLDEASMGRVYQWGRSNISWVTKGDDTLFGDEVLGPVTLADATNGANKNKFITNNEWLTIDGTFTQAMADALWTGANSQGPCPSGWRLPTIEEFSTVIEVWTSDKFKAAAHRLEITGDNGTDKLYFPATGARLATSGASFSQGVSGFYWASSVIGTKAFSLYFYPTGCKVNNGSRGLGFPVRCIQAN